MVTISLQLPDELARQVMPLQDRLPEIIQVGLQHWRRQASRASRQERKQHLSGRIAPGWTVVKPLALTWEQDADGGHVLSDGLFGVYGDGDTSEKAQQDYVTSLIDYYQLLAARATEDDPPARAQFDHLRQYLQCSPA
jgi:hypothetical protein